MNDFGTPAQDFHSHAIALLRAQQTRQWLLDVENYRERRSRTSLICAVGSRCRLAGIAITVLAVILCSSKCFGHRRRLQMMRAIVQVKSRFGLTFSTLCELESQGRPIELPSIGRPWEKVSVCVASHCLLEDTVQVNCELRQRGSTQQKILVIAEEASASSQLRQTLEVLGFDGAEVLSYEHALSCLRLFDYDAILLECSVFKRDVTAVCQELRRLYPRLPILVVGVDKSLDYMVALLEAGADDYTILPLAERLLAARLRSAIRRFRTPAIGMAERFVAGEIVLDPARHRVEKSGVQVPLSPTEFRALEVLMHRPGIPISHSALIATLWGLESKSTRKRLRVLIRGLRKKLENNPSNPRYLKTHAYIGYYFQDRECAM